MARRIGDGLIAYLALAGGRPAGALTPDEAAVGVESLTGDGDFALRAGRLIADCDRALFGAGGPSGDALAAEGRAFFGALGKVRVDMKGRAGKPREAPWTAEL